jgi:phosphate transport system protein
MTTRAVASIVTCDADLAYAVVIDEPVADTQARAIEHHAERLIATQAPVAGDMRQVAAALIVAQELERMADHAHAIALASERICDTTALEPLVQRVTDMLRLALQAYITGDAIQASRVAGMDDAVDELYRAYYQNLLASMTVDQQSIELGVMLMHVAYDLERIADRVTNVCERVVFIATGEVPMDLAVRDDAASVASA